MSEIYRPKLNDIPLEVFTKFKRRQCYAKEMANNDIHACWPWSETKSYAVIHNKGQTKTYFGHRVAYALAYHIPYAELNVIMHLCNNKNCINPYHLYHGTDSTNMLHRSMSYANEALSSYPILDAKALGLEN